MGRAVLRVFLRTRQAEAGSVRGVTARRRRGIDCECRWAAIFAAVMLWCALAALFSLPLIYLA